MKILAGAVLFLSFGLLAAVPPPAEAPTGFDNNSNGMVDAATHTADQAKFDEVEAISDGLGPLYNAQSCRECHQNPTSGGSSQVSELRVGHNDAKGVFQNPDIPINNGSEIIKARSLVNDRAICPSGAFPSTEIQEHVPDAEKIRTFRVSLNLLGDGFVEAVADQTLINIAKDQCKKTQGKICGQYLYDPIVESPGKTGIGRFGWKDQQASLLSFSADAYLNEMGITSRLQPDEVTSLCNTVSEPNDKPGTDGLSDIDHFARFMRASEAPPREEVLSKTPEAKAGEALFEKIGCATCHVAAMVTLPAGTSINGGNFTIPEALGDKTFHPYGDFLLHDIGTGDGIVQSPTEHYGRRYAEHAWANFSLAEHRSTARKMRTAPLWGVRMHSRLMHDGQSLTLRDAIQRHRGEASEVTEKFERLNPKEKQALLTFLRSL
ncbi:MAG TPA: di-heme oxidoredictase family protein [Candidatus Acidoferrum sp.]|nr:di-heme oxidoredictase family protein [Candidatus Acidoferrum sp.]